MGNVSVSVERYKLWCMLDQLTDYVKAGKVKKDDALSLLDNLSCDNSESEINIIVSDIIDNINDIKEN
jgi:hypothetical protein